MPATLDDLAVDLQQFFAARFPLDGDDGPGSVLLVFDNLGRPLSPKEFTGSDTGPARDLLSHQRAADLADQLPAGNALKRGWYLPRGGSRLSRWYADALRGSAGPPLSAGEADLAAFEAAKAEALRALDLNKLVLVSGTGLSGTSGTVPAAGTFETYYATSMSPLDWFTAASTDWNTYSVSAADQPAGATRVAPAGPVIQPQFSFLVAEDPQLPDLVTYVQYATETEPTPPDQPDPLEWKTLRDFGLRQRLETEDSVATLPLVLRAGVVDDTALTVDTEFTVDAADLISMSRAMNRSRIAALSEVLDEPVAAEADGHLVAALASQAAAEAVVGATVPTPATSRQFAVHFEYCLVRFDRPWWDDIFLHRRDWRVPGYATGQISSGSAADPHGAVTLITVGMLVIRNLTITASWSSSDLAALPRSTSLGPFCIAAADFDRTSGTLTRKGMQAVGWLLQVPPVLPPAA